MDRRSAGCYAFTLPMVVVATMTLAALVNFAGLSRAAVLTAYVMIGVAGLVALLSITFSVPRRRRSPRRPRFGRRRRG